MIKYTKFRWVKFMKNIFIKNKKKYQNVNVMLVLTLFVSLVSMASITATTGTAVRAHRDEVNIERTKQSYSTAESGIEDALYRLKNNMDIGTSETITLGNTTATSAITDIDDSQKSVASTAITNFNNRSLSVVLKQSEGVSFFYGMQAGTGGVTMNNSAGIIGNLYSNGPIVVNNSGYVTGSATSANGDSATVDQTFGSGTPATNNTFGNGTSTEDMAQSFRLTNTNYLSSAQVYIKKVGSPSNATVTIRTDNSSKPSGTIKATGTLSSSLVSTNYGWVNITFTTNPQLTASTTYWLTIDASRSASNYFVVGGDTGYANGTAKIGRVSSSTWNQLGTNTDLFFSISTGGAFGSISGLTVGSAGVGNAYSHTVTDSTVAGTIYCQTGSGNNKSCNTTLADPVTQNFPISDQNIEDWKEMALAGGTSSGISLSGSQTQSIGPKKINGSISLSNSAVLTVTGVLWVTGNISISNNTIIKLASSFGSDGGIIIVDGTISTNNSAVFNGSGTAGSYLMAISTNTGSSAIALNNSAGSVILIAPYGGITMNNSAGAKQVTAKSITLNNTATITYESGLADASFSTGPAGSWDILSWQEDE